MQLQNLLSGLSCLWVAEGDIRNCFGKLNDVGKTGSPQTGQLAATIKNVLASGKLWKGALDYLQSHPFCKKETLGS